LAASLVVLGLRWRLIDHAASPVPYLDQWYGEGLVLYGPAMQGHLPFANFFQPHNGHRIVPSRLLAYDLFRANGQWDARLQMVANALLAAALCFPLLALARRWLPPAALVIFAALLAWFYAQPILYENALWGFQSCFYFLVLFSLLQIQLMLHRPALSASWWLGVACGVCAALSMGSGLLSTAAVAGVAAGRALRERELRRELALTAAAAAVVLLIGAWWIPPDLRGYLGAQDTHLGPVFHTIVHALDFPQREYSLTGLTVWLPFAGFATTSLMLRRSTPAVRALLATGAWVLLQIAAMGYARPETGQVLANRYYEVLAVGLVANLATWGWLWHHAELAHRRLAWRILFATALAGWLAFAGRSSLETARMNRVHVVEAVIRPAGREQVERVSAFLHTDDPRFLANSSRLALPFPDVPALIDFLRLPALRAIMPAEVRMPINLRFPPADGQPSLDNAVPVSLPNEPGKLHRGTFFGPTGNARTIHVLSAPAAKSTTHLLFKVAGDLRSGETELRVLDHRGAVAAIITDVRSDTLKPVEITVPGPTFTVEVVDRSPQRWLAFVEPVEVGPLSHAAHVALRQASLVAWSGMAGLILLLAWTVWPRRQSSETSRNI
jgi:hypothetical protein